MSATLHFAAWGRPVPQGSIRSLGKGRPSIHGNAAVLLPWRDSITAAALLAMQADGWTRVEGPVAVRSVFFFDRPASHFGTGKNADRLKPAAPAWPCGRAQGDADKLARACLDALVNAGVVADDSQVAHLTAQKQWTATAPWHRPAPGAVITVRDLTDHEEAAA